MRKNSRGISVSLLMPPIFPLSAISGFLHLIHGQFDNFVRNVRSRVGFRQLQDVSSQTFQFGRIRHCVDSLRQQDASGFGIRYIKSRILLNQRQSVFVW